MLLQPPAFGFINNLKRENAPLEISSISGLNLSLPRVTMEQVGRYERYEEIGRGGMGTVYRARDTRLQREVALKLLPAYLSQDETFSQRFQREAEVIAQLEHPHIVPVYDAGEYEGQPFLVMRLLKGGTLRQQLVAGGITPINLAHISQQVAEALDAAHKQGVVHRDIKPSNILFDEHGSAFVADFGVAKVLGSTTQLTGSGVVGTPAYMSPEHFIGKGLDGRSDQYSLAIVIFEALTGELPFDGETVQQLIYQHLEGQPRSVHDLNPSLPITLMPVLAQALDKRSTNRFATTGAFAQALTLALEMPTQKTTSKPASVEVDPPSPIEKLPSAKPHESLSKTTAAHKLQVVYGQGLQALADEDWASAATAFANVLEQEPNHPKARSRYQEAQYHLNKGQKLPAAQLPAIDEKHPRSVSQPAAPKLEAGPRSKVVTGAGGQLETKRRYSIWQMILAAMLLIGAGLLIWAVAANTKPDSPLIVIKDVTATWTVEPSVKVITPVINSGAEDVVIKVLESVDGADELHFKPGEAMKIFSETGLRVQLPDSTELFLAAESEVEITNLRGEESFDDTVLLLRKGMVVVVAQETVRVMNPFGATAVAIHGTMGVTFSEYPFRFDVACFAGECQVEGDIGGILSLKPGQASFVGGSGRPGEVPNAVDYGRYAAFAGVVPTPTTTPLPSHTPTRMPTPVPTVTHIPATATTTSTRLTTLMPTSPSQAYATPLPLPTEVPPSPSPLPPPTTSLPTSYPSYPVFPGG